MRHDSNRADLAQLSFAASRKGKAMGHSGEVQNSTRGRIAQREAHRLATYIGALGVE